MLQKIFFIFILSFTLNAVSQNCTLKISGNIIDEHDKSNLDYANVYIQELEIGTAADSNGYYEFNNICPGKYSFIIDHIGCTSDTVIVNVTKSITKNFFLEHHAEELNEIITTTSRIEKESVQSTTTIDNKTLTKLEGKDLGNILSTIAGVNQLKTGTTISKPIIHGLYGDRISIVNNDVKLETQDWGSEHAPEIDPFASNQIRVVKGVGSLEYGTDAMGGLVLMDPPQLQKNKHLSAAISLIGQTNGRSITSSAKIEQGFKSGVAYFIQGTYKRLGDQQTPNYNLTNTALQEGNFSAGFGVLKKTWEINTYYSMFNQQLAILKSSHIGNLTDLKNAIASDTPLIVKPFTYKFENPQQKTQHHLGKINIVHYFKNQSKLDIIYSLQFNNRKEFDIRRGGRSEIPALDLKLLSNNILSTYKWFKQFTKKEVRLDGNAGINFLAKHNANNPETGIRPLIPDYYQYSIGVFNMEKISVKNFIVEVGARYDYTRFLAFKYDKQNNLDKPKFNFHTYALAAGASWKDNKENIQLQTNISYSSRFPNASELFSEGLHHGIAALEFGNQFLKPEKGVKWTSTVMGKFRNYFQTEATFYITKINDYIYLAPLPEPVLTIRGAFPAFQYYQTNARLIGFDITSKFKLFSFFSVDLRSSIVRGKNLSAKDNLIYMPSDRISTYFDAHYSFKKIKNVHLGLNVQHVFKQKNTPTQIIDYKATPNAYTTLDVDAGFEYVANEKNKIGFSVSAENISNAVYRDYLNRFRYYADELGWNLTFRLKYSFL